MAACVIAMRRGTECAAREDWEAASRYWLTGIQRYPFEQELPECREKLSDALVKAGDEVQARLLAEWPADQDVVGLTESLIRIREARSQAEEGDHTTALETLAAAMEIIRERVGESPDWNELLQQMEAEAARIRVAAGLGDSADDFLEALRGASDREFLKVLEEGLEKFAEDASFCAAAFAITRERLENTRLRTERECWSAFADLERADAALRAQAYTGLVDYDLYRLNMLRMTSATGLKVVAGAARSITRMAEDQRNRLLDTLEEAEDFVRGLDAVTHEGIDLTDRLHATYRSLGIASQPVDLYLHLATRTPLYGMELAKRAERMGEIEESIAALKELAGSQRIASAEDRAEDETLEELVRMLKENEKYKEAAVIQRERAKQAEVPGDGDDLWFEVAELLYKARDYDSASRVIRERLPQAEDEEMSIKLSGLLAWSAFNQFRFDEGTRLIDEAIRTYDMAEEQRGQFELLRAYIAVFQRQYEYGAALLEYCLETYPYDKRKRDQISAVIERVHQLCSKCQNF
jgi:hypothetical protein